MAPLPQFFLYTEQLIIFRNAISPTEWAGFNLTRICCHSHICDGNVFSFTGPVGDNRRVTCFLGHLNHIQCLRQGSNLIELYKNEAPVQTIGTVPSDRAHEWQVGLALEPGCDYSIKVKSSANGALFDVSDDTFSIDVPIGDFDCDGCVELDDLAVLTDEWLEEDGGLIANLYDDDNKVDFYDFAIYAEHYLTGACPWQGAIYVKWKLVFLEILTVCSRNNNT